MSLFRKNPNEIAYSGGKKHWTDVIKNSGPGEMLIWRQPEEDFNTNSTLIVMPGEEAIFINGGVIEQVFENGTYKLSTENYPFISRLRNAFSGGISTFNCVVYYVRKADSAEIFWGTSSPIQVRDSVWGIRTNAKARGAYKVRIENPPKLLEKLIGNNVPFQYQADLNRYFENEFQSVIRSALSKFLNNMQRELIGIDEHLEYLSESVEPFINEALEDYGMKCVKFSLAALDIDTTKYDQIDESQIAYIARQKGYQGDLAGLQILGNNWEKVRGVEILDDLANNPGAGGVAAAGAGMGLGFGAAGVFNTIANDVFSHTNMGSDREQNHGSPPPQSGRYTQAGAVAAQNKSGSPAAVLAELKKMLDAGLIDQSEYDAKKKEILERM